MTRRASYLLPGLLLAAALILTSCGASGGSQGGSQGGSDDSGDMQGMDHGDPGGSGGETTGKKSGMDMGETTGGMEDMEGMDHGSTGSEDIAAMSREMVMPNGEYSDAAFVDAMVPHHEGAVEMAEVGLENAEHGEIRQLSRDIIDSQRAEIEMLGRIREGLDGPTKEMSQEDMSMMGMMDDPQQLANEEPFDKAFIDAMTPHHESAIAMAEVALEESDDPEIRSLAEDIVSAQEREISQMKQWRQQWYPEG